MEQTQIQVADYTQALMGWISSKGLEFGWRLLGAAVIFILGAIVIRMLSEFLKKVVVQKMGGRDLLQRFIVSVVIKSAWTMLAIVVLGKLGVEVGPLIAGLGVTGFILGFAFQESLGSLAAGIMIAFNQPFKIGDYVQVAGFEGTVQVLDMMAVTLATGDNRRITIPNKQAWGSPIVNYSALELRRFEVVIGIAYGADIAKAKTVALETLGAMDAVLKNPAPMCEVSALDDSAVTLIVRGWVKNADYWSAFFAANQRVKEAFDRAAIEIPFPQMDVHVTNG